MHTLTHERLLRITNTPINCRTGKPRTLPLRRGDDFKIKIKSRAVSFVASPVLFDPPFLSLGLPGPVGAEGAEDRE